jgi:hypothetical protein
VARIQVPFAPAGASQERARIIAWSQGGLAISAILHSLSSAGNRRITAVEELFSLGRKASISMLSLPQVAHVSFHQGFTIGRWKSYELSARRNRSREISWQRTNLLAAKRLQQRTVVIVIASVMRSVGETRKRMLWRVRYTGLRVVRASARKGRETTHSRSLVQCPQRMHSARILPYLSYPARRCPSLPRGVSGGGPPIPRLSDDL